MGERVVIVGGGLVGSLLSIILARRNVPVEVYERRSDPRKATSDAGRSINLVVAARGFRGLEKVGLKEGVLELTVPVAGRMIHGPASEIDAAERSGVRFQFQKSLVEADLGAGRWRFLDESSSRVLEIEAPVVIGADGAVSAVRAQLVRQSGCDESLESLEYGYKELIIPAGQDGAYRIEKNALHIWPRGRVMLMALPNRDGSFTVTLYLPYRGEASFETLVSGARVVELFQGQFPDASELIPDLVQSFFDNPTGNLGTVRCSPWRHGGRVVLVGDAAHAIVPFFGQGMNCGFEDCGVLDELIERSGTDDWTRLFAEYETLRKPDTDAIAEMALENFIEMRDRVGDARFLLRKRVEHLLEERVPLEYRSRYSMVMYSHVPYRLAREVGRIQERILARLCSDLDSADELDLERARALIRSDLTPFLCEHSIDLDY